MRFVRSRALATLGLCVALACLALQALAGPQDLPAPVRLALLPGNQALVSDIRLRAVVQWDLERKRAIRTIRIQGKPLSVAWAWGTLIVGNDSRHVVEVYNPAGRVEAILGAEGQVQRPSDIAVDEKRGLIFVTDAKAARVVVYSRRGELVRTLPAPGEERLFQPTGLALDPERGEVLVSDFGSIEWPNQAWVRIYDYEGHYLDGIGGDQDSTYGFSRPEGLAVNGQGRIFLADSLRSQVLVFDRDTLTGVTLLGEPGTEPGQLWLPLDVAIDARTKDLFVTNFRLSTVEILRGAGEGP